MKNIVRLLRRFRQAKRELDSLRDREYWSRERITEWQLQKINTIWRSAIQEVPHYRELTQHGQLPLTFRSLDEYSNSVPVTEKAQVREHPEQFLSIKPKAGRWLRTSGSTGIYTRVYWEREAHHEMLRCKYRGEQAWGVDIFDRKALLWGTTNTCSSGLRGFTDRLIEPIVDRLRCRMRLSAYRLCDAELSSHLDKLQRFQAVSIYGYSSALAMLAKHACQTDTKLPHLRLVIMTGETADETMISQCQKGFRCGVAVEYGYVECGLLGYRYLDGKMRVREDHIFMETKRRDDGFYDIIVTVLNNPSFPLLRYRIGDTSTAPLSLPEFGFAHIEQLAGRENDMLISKTGHLIHSMAIKHTIENHPQVRRFTAIQRPDGSLDVTLETSETDVTAFSQCCEVLANWLDGFPIHVKLTNQLNATPSGKHRWIYTEFRARETCFARTENSKERADKSSLTSQHPNLEF